MPVVGDVAGKLIKNADDISSAGKRLVSKIKDATNPQSVANIKTDVPKAEFEANLMDNGFEKSTSKDGKVNIFTKGDQKFTTRDTSASTGGPTAEAFQGGELKSKIRLDEKL